MAIFGGDPLLSLLSVEDRETLLELGSERRYAAGQRILSQGNTDHFVVLILHGWTVVRAEAQNGRSIIFGLCGPMDVVGEMAALDGGSRSATVTALVDVHARAVPAADFLGFLGTRPSARDAMTRSLSSRLRAADDQSQALATLTVLQRVARLLLDLDRTTAAAAVPAQPASHPLPSPQCRPSSTTAISNPPRNRQRWLSHAAMGIAALRTWRGRTGVEPARPRSGSIFRSPATRTAPTALSRATRPQSR